MTKEARVYNGEKTVSSANGVGKVKTICKSIKLEYILMPHTKTNSKWTIYVNVKDENITFLEWNKYKSSWSWLEQSLLRNNTQNTSDERENR